MIDRDLVLRALARLAQHLVERGEQGELCLLGGTVMMLVFGARNATKDVDAVFRPTSAIRDAAAEVAAELGLPEDWLNDGAKGFVSATHEVLEGDLPQFEGLRIVAPTPEYMFAMKAIAARVGLAPGDPGDVGDLQILIARLGIKTIDDALSIVARYYPAERIPPRTAYLLEELLPRGGAE